MVDGKACDFFHDSNPPAVQCTISDREVNKVKIKKVFFPPVLRREEEYGRMKENRKETRPPTFVIFVNDKQLFHFSYERYLVNQFRKEFGLEGTPVRIIVREKVEK